VALTARVPEEAHIERWAAERSTNRLSNVLERPVTISVTMGSTPIRTADEPRVE